MTNSIEVINLSKSYKSKQAVNNINFKINENEIVGLLKRLIIVDSTPIWHLPPSKTYLILDPNSSFTSDALTELNLVDIFALGAASG